ncbi:MAG: hypothetical protein HY815_14425, partial [Candidatus Riflebacteria bacterium]|nr:hypothetical protein [Candidatus Riflebacteria bacterium]
LRELLDSSLEPPAGARSAPAAATVRNERPMANVAGTTLAGDPPAGPIAPGAPDRAAAAAQPGSGRGRGPPDRQRSGPARVTPRSGGRGFRLALAGVLACGLIGAGLTVRALRIGRSPVGSGSPGASAERPGNVEALRRSLDPVARRTLTFAAWKNASEEKLAAGDLRTALAETRLIEKLLSGDLATAQAVDAAIGATAARDDRLGGPALRVASRARALTWIAWRRRDGFDERRRDYEAALAQGQSTLLHMPEVLLREGPPRGPASLGHLRRFLGLLPEALARGFAVDEPPVGLLELFELVHAAGQELRQLPVTSQAGELAARSEREFEARARGLDPGEPLLRGRVAIGMFKLGRHDRSRVQPALQAASAGLEELSRGWNPEGRSRAERCAALLRAR